MTSLASSGGAFYNFSVTLSIITIVKDVSRFVEIMYKILLVSFFFHHDMSVLGQYSEVLIIDNFNMKMSARIWIYITRHLRIVH